MLKAIFWLAAATLLAGCAGGAGQRDAPQHTVSAVLAESAKETDVQSRARAKAHTELAGQYLTIGQGGTALTSATTAVAADPGYAPAQGMLGLCYMFLGENALAESSFQKAMRLAPGDPEIQNNYGWFLCKTGRASAAIPYFRQAAANSLYQTPEIAYANLGYCYQGMNDLTQAEANYRKALQYGKPSAQIAQGLAEVYFLTGRYNDALNQLALLHRLVLPTPESLWLGVRVARRAGDESALQSFSQALHERFPESDQYSRLTRGAFD